VAHDGEHLTKFEELLEAAVDLDFIPEDYLICASYNPRLKVLAVVQNTVHVHHIHTLILC
jgi:hypothetical protein